MTTAVRLPDPFTPGRTRTAAATPTCCCCCCCCAISTAATSVALPAGFLADTRKEDGSSRSWRRTAGAIGLALVPAATIALMFGLAVAGLYVFAVVIAIAAGLAAAWFIASRAGDSETAGSTVFRFMIGAGALFTELVVGVPLIDLFANLPFPAGLVTYLSVAVIVAVLVLRMYLPRPAR